LPGQGRLTPPRSSRQSPRRRGETPVTSMRPGTAPSPADAAAARRPRLQASAPGGPGSSPRGLQRLLLPRWRLFRPDPAGNAAAPGSGNGNRAAVAVPEAKALGFQDRGALRKREEGRRKAGAAVLPSGWGLRGGVSRRVMPAMKSAVQESRRRPKDGSFPRDRRRCHARRRT
jgi:hypothetical protein